MVNSGKRWCTGCKAWHGRDAFGFDRDQADGLARTCLEFRRRRGKQRYVPKPKPRPQGRSYVPARDGDRKQARGRVNSLVQIGVLPNPNTLACVDCGHLGKGRRHEYHHHRGYAAANHETVIALCTRCHGRRQ